MTLLFSHKYYTYTWNYSLNEYELERKKKSFTTVDFNSTNDVKLTKRVNKYILFYYIDSFNSIKIIIKTYFW